MIAPYACTGDAADAMAGKRLIFRDGATATIETAVHDTPDSKTTKGLQGFKASITMDKYRGEKIVDRKKKPVLDEFALARTISGGLFAKCFIEKD